MFHTHFFGFVNIFKIIKKKESLLLMQIDTKTIKHNPSCNVHL